MGFLLLGLFHTRTFIAGPIGGPPVGIGAATGERLTAIDAIGSASWQVAQR